MTDNQVALEFQLKTLRSLYALDEQELIERSYVDILSTHARHCNRCFVCSLFFCLLLLSLSSVEERWQLTR